MTTLTFEHMTFTVKDGFAAGAMPFPLFQKEGETDNKFLCRIYGWANRWCQLAKETDIPEAGPVRNCWDNYIMIGKMEDEELEDEIYDVTSNDDCKMYDTQGVYARCWLSLLNSENLRRKTSG
jgi:hypothetical protein